MTITEMVQRAGANAGNKGWLSLERTFGDELMLVVSELAEALEDYRDNLDPDEVYWFEPVGSISIIQHSPVPKGMKPNGIPYELADAVIRIGQIAAKYNIDLEHYIQEKMDYNETRTHRHGGKRL